MTGYIGKGGVITGMDCLSMEFMQNFTSWLKHSPVFPLPFLVKFEP